jgi:hypothetical protein
MSLRHHHEWGQVVIKLGAAASAINRGAVTHPSSAHTYTMDAAAGGRADHGVGGCYAQLVVQHGLVEIYLLG